MIKSIIIVFQIRSRFIILVCRKGCYFPYIVSSSFALRFLIIGQYLSLTSRCDSLSIQPVSKVKISLLMVVKSNESCIRVLSNDRRPTATYALCVLCDDLLSTRLLNSLARHSWPASAGKRRRLTSIKLPSLSLQKPPSHGLPGGIG